MEVNRSWDKRAAETVPTQAQSMEFTALVGSMGTQQTSLDTRDTPQPGTIGSELQAIAVSLGLRLKAMSKEVSCHLYSVDTVETVY